MRCGGMITALALAFSVLGATGQGASDEAALPVLSYDLVRPDDTGRVSSDPVLRVFGDGRVVVLDPWRKDATPEEVRMDPSRLVKLMRVVTQDLGLMALSTEKILAAVEAERARRRMPELPFSGPITSVRATWEGKTCEVALASAPFYFDNFPDIEPVKQFAMICSLLRTLRLETAAGGPAVVQAALAEINDRLGQPPDPERMRRTRFPGQRSPLSIKVTMRTTDLESVQVSQRVADDLLVISERELSSAERRALERQLERGELTADERRAVEELLKGAKKKEERLVKTLLFSKRVRQGADTFRVEARAEVDGRTGEVISAAVAAHKTL